MTLFKVLSLLFAILIILALISWFMLSRSKWPVWAMEPCDRCGGTMKWLKGCDSNSTAEAKFECVNCADQQFRGGWCSEITMDRHENETPN